MTVERRFVSLVPPHGRRAGAGGAPTQGLYHVQEGRPPRVAVLASHYEVDFAEHYLAPWLAERGIGFLGWNTRFRDAGHLFHLDTALGDLGAGVRWLREEGGADRVVLLGNSGGASLLAALQALAADDAERGDAFISLNAHPGRPDVLTRWLDPSVTDEADPVGRDADLDMFDERHGPPYDPAFVERYRAAQVARNERITDWCEAERARLVAGGGTDRVFGVPRTWADLRFADLALDPSDRPAGCYLGDPARANALAVGLAAVCSIGGWLEMWSLRQSRCRATDHLAAVEVPALVVQSTADRGCFPSDARAIHGALTATDAHLEWVPGDHYLTDPDDRRRVADLLADWIHGGAGR